MASTAISPNSTIDYLSLASQRPQVSPDFVAPKLRTSSSKHLKLRLEPRFIQQYSNRQQSRVTEYHLTPRQISPDTCEHGLTGPTTEHYSYVRLELQPLQRSCPGQFRLLRLTSPVSHLAWLSLVPRGHLRLTKGGVQPGHQVGTSIQLRDI